jgi:hypothetical protein
MEGVQLNGTGESAPITIKPTTEDKPIAFDVKERPVSPKKLDVPKSPVKEQPSAAAKAADGHSDKQESEKKEQTNHSDEAKEKAEVENKEEKNAEDKEEVKGGDAMDVDKVEEKHKEETKKKADKVDMKEKEKEKKEKKEKASASPTKTPAKSPRPVKAKESSDDGLKVGSLVWAHVKGSPWWPARVRTERH